MLPAAAPRVSAADLALDVRGGVAAADDLRVGIDTVRVSGIEASLLAFGERFVNRLYTAHEIATVATPPARRAERLAARFAAKEAAIKAFDLAEVGVDWRDIEVRSDTAGRPSLALHGRAAAFARRSGSARIALSLSHDGDQACAVVAALFAGPAVPLAPFVSTHAAP